VQQTSFANILTYSLHTITATSYYKYFIRACRPLWCTWPVSSA